MSDEEAPLTSVKTYTDLFYDEQNGVATITINRPEKYNAFRGLTCDELIDAFNRAGWNGAIGVIVLTGAGTKAFCTGGDQSAHQGGYDGRGTIGLPMEALHAIIRGVPQPVIAKVRGYAIGGGNVLATLCDLTIAGESAQFGQVGPKVGSVDPGFGTAYLARVVGEKKAREIWYLCRRYSAQEALGAHQHGGARRSAGHRGRSLVPRDLGAQPDRYCCSQTVVQCRQRQHRGHCGDGTTGAEAVL
jgi:2-ketocyclohexanecarboxyl-CoA hydrolase